MIVFSYGNTVQLCTLNLLHLHSLHWLFRLKCTCSTVKEPINLLRFPAPFCHFTNVCVEYIVYIFLLSHVLVSVFVNCIWTGKKRKKEMANKDFETLKMDSECHWVVKGSTSLYSSCLLLIFNYNMWPVWFMSRMFDTLWRQVTFPNPVWDVNFINKDTWRHVTCIDNAISFHSMYLETYDTSVCVLFYCRVTANDKIVMINIPEGHFLTIWLDNYLS